MSRSTPPPSSYVARRTMESNRRTDTGPERLLRSELHARGLRYRKDRPLDVAGRRVRPDLVFGPAKVAVFVDGCFWHRCPRHATHPSANAEYWQAKFDRNVARDRADDAALDAAGWTVVRVWEHENPAEAGDRVEAILRGRLGEQLEAERARIVAINEERASHRGYLVFATDPEVSPDEPGYREVYATEARTPNQAMNKVREIADGRRLRAYLATGRYREELAEARWLA